MHVCGPLPPYRCHTNLMQCSDKVSSVVQLAQAMPSRPCACSNTSQPLRYIQPQVCFNLTPLCAPDPISPKWSAGVWQRAPPVPSVSAPPAGSTRCASRAASRSGARATSFRRVGLLSELWYETGLAFTLSCRQRASMHACMHPACTLSYTPLQCVSFVQL